MHGLLAVSLVLSSGFVHSIWNLFTKRSIDKNVFLWFCQWVAAAVFLPWAVIELLQMHIHIALSGLFILVFSMLLHGLYVILLAKTYTLGDLSQVYPIMRGTSPLLVPLAAVAILHETLHLLGWLGILLIVAGILIISGLSSARLHARPPKSIMYAIGVGISIAGYIVIDKIALAYWPPIVLNEWTSIGNGIALTFAVMHAGNHIRNEWTINRKTIVLGGIIAPGGYILFLYALSLAAVSRLAPMREIGVVFGTLLGIFILHEKQGKSRIIASIIITAGVILLGFNS